MFFHTWQQVGLVAGKGVLAYLFLIVLLRVTGKRTLSSMNAFDFIVTVASGSAFAATLLNSSVSLLEGFTAFTVLVLMQGLVAWASAHSERVEDLVKSVPTILLWDGRMLPDVMRAERVTEAEVLAACRHGGYASVEDVQAVVLETAGEFSVLGRSPRAVSELDTLRTASNVPGEFR